MVQSENNSLKTEFKEALKSKFFSFSVILFWLLTCFAFAFAKYKIEMVKTHNQQATEMSSQSIFK